MRPAVPLAIALGAMLSVATPAFAQAAQSAPARATGEEGKTPGADGQAAAAADHPANAPGAEGSDGLLRAQVLLERARFSPGEIDGQGGANTRRAIAAFQRSRDLEPSGELDEATWKALDGDAAPVLVQYTVTAADVAGPFNELPDGMMEQAELDALGFESVAEALGERFHASPALLARLNPGKDLGAAGTTLVVPGLETAVALKDVERVVVDKSESVLQLVAADGRIVAQFPASTGSEHDPLPIGEWTIRGVAPDPTFHYNPELFWNADPSHAKATIAPGPNNPVGVAWIDLSKEHYGIHGTPEPGNVGKTDSNGCIRLANWHVALVAGAVKPGMTAVLQE